MSTEGVAGWIITLQTLWNGTHFHLHIQSIWILTLWARGFHPGEHSSKEAPGTPGKVPCCRLRSTHPSLGGAMVSLHTANTYSPTICVQTPAGTGTHPLKPSLCRWCWPDPEGWRGTQDAGGKGGEGWAAQFLGWYPDNKPQKGRAKVTLHSHTWQSSGEKAE